DAQCPRDPGGEVDVDEAVDVWRVVHDAGPVIEWPGRRARGAGQITGGRAHRRERGSGAFRDRRDDVDGTAARGRPLVARDDARDRLLVARDDAADVRRAEIDAEIEAQTLGSLPASSGACSAVASPPNTCCCAAL